MVKTCSHYSKSIKKNNEISYIYGNKINKVIWFLHGLSRSNKDYLEDQKIIELAKKEEILFIMVNADRSFYCNLNNGLNYYDYLTKEIDAIIEADLKINLKDYPNYIMGISMGGYGALKLALNQPKKYQGVASISGSVDIIKRDIEKRLDPKVKDEWIEMFAEQIDPENDLFCLLNKDIKMNIYLCCGNQDYLKSYNDSFDQKIISLKAKHKYKYETGDGEHNSKYFYPHIFKAIEFLLKGEK